MNAQRNFLLSILVLSVVTFSGCGESSDDSAATADTTTTVVNTTVTTTATTTDVNGTTIIVLTSYDLIHATEDDMHTMGLNDTKSMSFYVQNNSGEKISDSDMTSLIITLTNPALGELRDIDSNTGDTLSFTTNNASVSLESNTVSGLMPIYVVATFLDSDGTTQTLYGTFGITILSGPPTAMSISYEGTEHDEVNAKFIDRMIVTVTDKYFNKVNTNPSVSASMIAGYALETPGDQTTRLFIETTDVKAGTMKPATNVLTTSATLTNVDIFNDFVLTYGNGYTYNVSGKWEISSISGADISLVDDINASTDVSNIGFVIGNNFRQDVCRDGREWLGYVTVVDDKIDDEGNAAVEIHYDYYMTGKTIAIGVDTIGYTADGNLTSKFGEIAKHTLRSTGFTADGSCTISAGVVGAICNIGILINDTGEYLRNANFGYELTTGDEIAITAVTSQMDDLYDCSINGGIMNQRFVVTNFDVNESGIVSIDKILIGSEF